MVKMYRVENEEFAEVVVRYVKGSYDTSWLYDAVDGTVVIAWMEKNELIGKWKGKNV